MIVVSLLFFTYLITIGVFVYGFDRVKDFTSKEGKVNTKFTIIIPFRDEAKNLPKLLESINSLEYPASYVEFIFVDDASIDTSIDIINNHFDLTPNLGPDSVYLEHFDGVYLERRRKAQCKLRKARPDISIIKNYRTSNSPKKDAISTALKMSVNEWVVTTDADCVLPENWLKTIDNFIQQNDCNLIVSPVTYIANKSFLHQFQLLDFLSLQASTISGFGLGKPFLCNGANLTYKKDIFEKVNGFENNNSIASGDDIFLLEKFLQFDPSKVTYLKSQKAIVKTFPVNTFNELLHQRIRWASKTASYNLFFGKLIGILILLGNGIVALSPLLVFYTIISMYTAISYFVIKLFFDYLLLERVGRFYKQKRPLLSYICSSILYPYFIVLVVLKSFFSNYTWKGRTFKK
jgi:cellulose synthase/poly-beta-1,6-N-acetylglucosamine synthase-like glycosyltransferase